MRDELCNLAGLLNRHWKHNSFRQNCGKPHGRFAVTGNPVQRSGVSIVVLGLEGETVAVFHIPMRVDNAVRMLMRRVAIVLVQERSLGERQHETGRHSKMDRPAHDPISYCFVEGPGARRHVKAQLLRASER